METFAYNPKNKSNKRWPGVPMLHRFSSEIQTWSHCGRVQRDNDKYIYVDGKMPDKSILVGLCEHCFYGDRSRAYEKLIKRG